MTRLADFHIGLDAHGDRCWRMRSPAEARRCRERVRLQPRIAWLIACRPGREVWRNGLHRQRWTTLTVQVRGDRCCFLTTLKRPPLISPHRPF